MEEKIRKYLVKNVGSHYSWKIAGIGRYFQVFIEAGQCINIELFKKDIEGSVDDVINIDVSCVCENELGYCLLIDIYW